ncbi:protein FAM227B isoform X1 [Rana temporaria]|uniref:protein FAM227B isoform X1 n=1 Tax=Rana temporaria TaxID=8407 RepID=UPI001AAC4ED8|nr:protein FAM227B isoform X1 [Rana temporaria]
MEKPPSTFEEFLNFRHLKNWPENPFLEENLPGDLFSANNFSLEMINEEFLRKVPFNSNVFEDFEAEIAKDLTFLDSYSSQIIYLPTSEDHLCSVNRAFVTEVEFHELSQKAQDKIEALSRINYGTENFVENCVFPDFSGADLPGHLEATQILQCIAKTKQYQDLHGKMLSKFLLSEDSVAMLKDCFWWFFLHRFKPQQLAQDHLFDRLSDTFVALFCRVPTDVKDFFFKMYPNYLSQAVFTAFYKAFPQSLPQFNGEFKSEIVDLIFQWVSGIKPVPCSWKKWDLHFLDKSDQFSKGNVTLPLENQPNEVKRHLEFNLDNLIQDARESNLPKTVDKEETDSPAKESHSIGPGPEFHHTLFQMGGHSLLVSNYLKRHKLKDFIHVNSRHKLKRTEISKVPPVGPTYEDVIRETQKNRKLLQQECEMLEAKTQKELAEIQQQNVKVKKQIQKMKQELISGGKHNTTLLLEKLHKMSFSSKLFMKDNLTIQDILDAEDSEPDSEQTLVML